MASALRCAARARQTDGRARSVTTGNGPAAMTPIDWRTEPERTRKTATQQIELHSKCALTEGASERRMRHKKKKRKKKNSNGQRLCFDQSGRRAPTPRGKEMNKIQHVQQIDIEL